MKQSFDIPNELRFTRQLSTLIIGLLTIVYLYTVLFHNPMGAVLSLLSDDAFYYFKIASHIVAGEGSTFDGIARTNGYHPLWMIVLLGVFSLFARCQVRVADGRAGARGAGANRGG